MVSRRKGCAVELTRDGVAPVAKDRRLPALNDEIMNELRPPSTHTELRLGVWEDYSIRRPEKWTVFPHQLRCEWAESNDLQHDFFVFRAIPMHPACWMFGVA
ncbi:hypothetical protein WDZ92_38720, partial [Nostoc sp. NIES-2111]